MGLPWRRRFLSRGYNLLVRTFLGTRVRDCDCALKVFRKTELSHLLPESRNFFVNTEIPGDRLRWTLAHEIGHVVMHLMPSPDQEKEADRFAAERLAARAFPPLDAPSFDRATAAGFRVSGGSGGSGAAWPVASCITRKAVSATSGRSFVFFGTGANTSPARSQPPP